MARDIVRTSSSRIAGGVGNGIIVRRVVGAVAERFVLEDGPLTRSRMGVVVIAIMTRGKRRMRVMMWMGTVWGGKSTRSVAPGSRPRVAIAGSSTYIFVLAWSREVVRSNIVGIRLPRIEAGLRTWRRLVPSRSSSGGGSGGGVLCARVAGSIGMAL